MRKVNIIGGTYVGMKGFFHQWMCSKDDKTWAIVELPDGRMIEPALEFVQFMDTPTFHEPEPIFESDLSLLKLLTDAELVTKGDLIE